MKSSLNLEAKIKEHSKVGGIVDKMEATYKTTAHQKE